MMGYEVSHRFHLLRGYGCVAIGRVPVSGSRESLMHDPQVDIHEGIWATVVRVTLARGVGWTCDGPLADCLGW